LRRYDLDARRLHRRRNRIDNRVPMAADPASV
jgi:hypothetical protein